MKGLTLILQAACYLSGLIYYSTGKKLDALWMLGCGLALGQVQP